MRSADMVAETCVTTGTGAFSLGGALSNYYRFRGKLPTGSKVRYFAKTTQSSPNGRKWEYGDGTLTYGSPDTLSRDTVKGSSNSDAAVSWTATDLYIVYLAPSLDIISAILQPLFVDNGAANLTITAAHMGNVIDFDVTAANRTCTLPAGATLGHGFQVSVYGYGSTSNNVALTPNGSEKFNEGTAGATLNVVGGGMKTIAWDDTKGAWRVY